MKGMRPMIGEEVSLCLEKMVGRMLLRNSALLLLGVNTGFRISELLSLRLGDVIELDGGIKDRLTVWRRNMKGKRQSRSILLNEKAHGALAMWLEELGKGGFVYKDDFIFRSVRGRYAIDRVQGWKILHVAILSAGLKGRFGTHCMRKTFANNVYRYYLNQVARGLPVDAFRATSKALGHADIKSTDQYLSFLEEEVDEAVRAIAISSRENG